MFRHRLGREDALDGVFSSRFAAKKARSWL
jgi:hypothetical protein